MTAIRYRPLGPWTEPHRKPVMHGFSASWIDTLELLRHEVAAISIRVSPEVVIEVDVKESDIRADGFMRADRRPTSNRVRVSFDSEYGQLSYPCATFDGTYKLPGWQANIRAIALGLTDLRRLDRYGIANRGQQYTGWKAIGSGFVMPAATMTVEEARRFMWKCAGFNTSVPGHFATEYVFRLAAKIHHPDAGGDPDTFRRLTEARDLLNGVLT